MSLSLEAWEYGFALPGQALSGEAKGGPVLRLKAGSRIRLAVTNRGSLNHVLAVVDQGGGAYTAGAATRLLEPGQGQTIEFTAEKTGSYLYVCPVSGHWAQGMAGSFTIEP